MTDARETVPCRLCGKPTPMTGTKLCDRHWELEGRVLAEPDMTRRILASHTGEAEPMPEGWKLVEKKTCYALLDGDTVVASLAGPDAERYAAIIARNLATPPAATPAAPGEVVDALTYRHNVLCGIADWLETRSATSWAEQFGYSGLMKSWSEDLRQIDAALSTPAPVAAPASEQDALIFKLECFIDHATGGKLSKSSWALETLKAAHDEHLNSFVNEALAERVESHEQPDYEALEREHMGDPDKQTGIYSPRNRLGSWLSAALEDPAVCEEMKQDIRDWFAAAPAPASEAVALTDEQISAARLRIRPCPVPGVTFQWLCEFARALPIPTPGDSADAPVQQAADRRGVYAWVTPTGHASLVLVDKRPTAHSPGRVLNATVMESSKFYDGCAVEHWGKDGRWVLLHDFDAALKGEQPAQRKEGA